MLSQQCMRGLVESVPSSMFRADPSNVARACHRRVFAIFALQTPDKHNPCSKRAFDGMISAWRRALHQWDAGVPAGPAASSRQRDAQLAARRRRVQPIAVSGLSSGAAGASDVNAASRAAFMSPAPAASAATPAERASMQ